jgi:uncharacterized integral membrane protein
MNQHSDVDDRSLTTQARDVGRGLRLFVVAALVAAIVIVALDNRDDVRLGYVFGDAQAPVWIALVAAGIVGVMIGWLLKHRSHRH